MSEITELGQKLTSDDLVTLFVLDATALGDSQIRRFTADGEITFDEEAYTQVAIEANGFEWSGAGAPPTPTIRVANVGLIFGALARDYRDLVGARLTRIRTFRTFLDDGDTPDPEMRLPIDEFVIERKSSQNKVFLEFELSVPFDQEGAKLPNRVMLRDYCTHIYRRWNGSSFDMSKATCPYAGTRYFKKDNTSTSSPAEDVCGKNLSSCQLRFENDPLPTRAFPGLARVR